jgi:hypothetical protein
MAPDRQNSHEEVLQNEKSKHSALGVYISQRGITFCLRPAHQDVSVSFSQAILGEHSKADLMAGMREFHDFIYSGIPLWFDDCQYCKISRSKASGPTLC